jgi:hypothetical protein
MLMPTMVCLEKRDNLSYRNTKMDLIELLL